MADYRFVPEGYLESMLEDIPDYPELQAETVRATEGLRVARSSSSASAPARPHAGSSRATRART